MKTEEYTIIYGTGKTGTVQAASLLEAQAQAHKNARKKKTIALQVFKSNK